MLATVVASGLLLASVVAAQNQVINVGPDGFFFSPNNVTATAGSVITFVWATDKGVHSVTQSSFASPCEHLEGGFDSGEINVPANFKGPQAMWNLTVSGTDPIWFYCKTADPQLHCTGGMVGSINPPTSGSNTMQAFVSAAQKASPNATQPTTGALGTAGASATAQPAPLASGVIGLGLPGASGPVQGSVAATGASGSGSAPSPTGSAGATPSKGAAVLTAANAGLALGAALLGALVA